MVCNLACLLPVRNGSEYLGRYLDSVAGIADTVIALDDGSTDDTHRLLQANPLVGRLLRNPERPTFAGWDDAENRRRLLAAAADIAPTWILWLDVDEIIDGGDAAALSELLRKTRPQPLAFGFRVFRMIDTADRYDKDGLWVFRLFPFRANYTLPAERLHFEPVPTEIPQNRWIKTTLRIKHLASLTEQRRAFRHRKYAEADPDCRFQDNYENLLDPPKNVKHWEQRPHDMRILWNESDETLLNAKKKYRR